MTDKELLERLFIMKESLEKFIEDGTNPYVIPYSKSGCG